jgi:inorganic triphosphatase YgiF
MRPEDLEQFEVADGLVARMTAYPGQLSDAERDYLLFQAARALALAGDLSGEEAYRLIYPFTAENQTTITASSLSATVVSFGRVLFRIRRPDLRGLCHPERN